jgi:hypothetical protein
VKGWKKLFQANRVSNQVLVVTYIPDKADFKQKLITRDKEGYFILIKEIIHQKKIMVINTYILNFGNPTS